MKLKSESEVTQSCPTPSDPMDCSPSGSSIHVRAQESLWIWTVYKCCSEIRNSFLLCWIFVCFNCSWSTVCTVKFPSFQKTNPLWKLYPAPVCVLVAQSCLTLCDPMDCSSPGSSVHDVLQARLLEWVCCDLLQRYPSHAYHPITVHEPYFASIIF